MSLYQEVKHIVLVGVGPVTLAILKKADRLIKLGAKLTILHDQPSWFFENMIADVIGGDYKLDAFRLDLKTFAETGQCIFFQDKVISILSNQNKLLTNTGRMLHYDAIVFETGADELGEEAEIPAFGKLSIRPIHNVLKICNEIETLLELFPDKILNLVILGGNELCVEYALSIQSMLYRRKLHKQCKLKIVEAQSRLVKYQPKKVAQIIHKFCVMSDIDVLVNQEIEHIQSNRLVLSKGVMLEFDMALLGYAYQAPEFFSKAGYATNEKRAVFTDHSLRIENEQHMFAVSTCAQIRDQYHAMRFETIVSQGPVLLKNLEAWLTNKAMSKWKSPHKDKTFISLGEEYAVLRYGQQGIYGKWCQRLRRYRDKQYMKQWLQMLK